MAGSSVAAKVLAATGDVEIVQTMLGHACLDHSKPHLTVDMQAVRRDLNLHWHSDIDDSFVRLNAMDSKTRGIRVEIRERNTS